MVLVPRSGISYRAMNTAFNFSVALFALVLLVPMFLIIARVIKISSLGPVMFRQMRYDLKGKAFSIYKFHTMLTDTCHHPGVAQTLKFKPRVTGIERLLRKISFEGLWRILIIFKREMSVARPRPHVLGLLNIRVSYEVFDPRCMLRQKVRPGDDGTGLGRRVLG